MVRIDLHGRRVGGWVVQDHVAATPGLTLKPIAKVSGMGPTPDLIDLAEWAAWRWAGRPASLLRTASPERMVHADGVARRSGADDAEPAPLPSSALGRAALEHDRAVVRLPPASTQYEIVTEAVSRGNALVLVPSLASARRLSSQLRRDGVAVALYPDEWARTLTGVTVVGARAAAWSPMVDLAAVVVLDEHDEGWKQEQAPTWHARDVVIERARRAGVPCVLVSPVPSLEALDWGTLVTTSRTEERNGWPLIEVVDRREQPPGAGLLSDALARLLHDGRRVACVLNRKGRSRLLACGSCGAIASCEQCSSAVTQDDSNELRCAQCEARRPMLCLDCGATRFRNIRAGVARVREELEALSRRPVTEITADTDEVETDGAEVFVGTEAVLHRLRQRVDAVVFLDFDQELLAPRYRAAEEAMALLVRAARMVGGRARGGRVLVQTRMPEHEVVQAAQHADPDRFTEAERRRRSLLRFPPLTAMAVVSGPSSARFVEAFGRPEGVQVMGPADGRWLLRADSHAPLLDALAATARPGGRLRIEVDPLRL
jgi:primosomal protein N' (replication factor Y) (superfamily II helicase)